MRKVYTSIILLLTMLIGAMSIAQEGQKKYINYQGVARDADGNLINGEPLTIGVKLNFGSSGAAFEETHEITTDANGVFSLLIGKGNLLSGEYNNLPWGEFSTSATVSINGNDIGTTELMAVPHALSSADNKWHSMGDDIENKNGGNVFITGSLYASKDLSLAEGAAVNEFSTDITLAENSDEIVPTQKAIKTYVDSQLGSGGGGGADDQNAAEVAYDNATSGLAATTAQDAIDELVGSGGVDADADPTNELQLLSFDAATNELSLTNGGMVTIPSGGTDADADPLNEIQDIELLGTELTITEGSTIDLAPLLPPGGTDDQNLIFDETTKMLEIEGGNTVDLSSLSSGPGGSSLWTDNGGDIYYNSGKVGVGTNTPEAIVSIETDGNNWDLSATEGDFRIGDAAHRLKIGLATAGGGAGDARIRVEGGTDRMMLGGGTNDVLTITDQNVGVGTITPSAKLDVDGNIRSSDLSGGGNVIADADGNLIIGGGGGSSLWTDNGGDIYYNSGEVGVGTTNPTSKLQVSQDSGGIPFLKLETTAGDDSDIRFAKAGVNETWDQIATIGADDASSQMDLSFYDGGTLHPIMSLRGNKRMGINNPNPQTALDVGGEIRSSDLAGAGERNVMADANGNLIIGAGGGGSSLWTQVGTNINYTAGRVGIGSGSESSIATLEVAGEASGEGILNVKETAIGGRNLAILGSGLQGRSSGTNSGLWLNNDGGNIYMGGDVGIALGFGVTPTAKLDVDGNIRSSDLIGGGNVVADADGKLIIGAGGGGSSLWTDNGGDIYFDSGNVGIGTVTPNAPLEIKTANGRPFLMESTSSNSYMQYATPSGRIGYSGVWSGDNDVDFGTTDSNPTGRVHLTTEATPRLTVSANGDVGIGTTTPTTKLDVDGDIKTSGEVHGPDTGNANMIPIAYGTIFGDGTITATSGNFSANRTGPGFYRIEINGENIGNAHINIATKLNSTPGFISAGSQGGDFVVITRNITGVQTDTPFSFVIYKP